MWMNLCEVTIKVDPGTMNATFKVTIRNELVNMTLLNSVEVKSNADR